MAQVEAVVQPHRVTDDLRGKSMSLVCVHPRIISSDDLTCQYRHWDSLRPLRSFFSERLLLDHEPVHTAVFIIVNDLAIVTAHTFSD
jgi:hypothetical protein